MSNAIDFNQILREACVTALAEHIMARLAQTGCVLLKGSAIGHARFFVSRWSDANVRVFYVLVKASGRFYSHAQLAREAESDSKATSSFWTRTLKRMRIAARVADTKEDQRLRLFRRGREMFWSQLGIKLQVNASMLDFDLARTVTDTTIGQTVAHRLNYEGACAAQEADATKTQEERVEAREKLDAEIARPEVVQQQTALFGTDGGSQNE